MELIINSAVHWYLLPFILRSAPLSVIILSSDKLNECFTGRSGGVKSISLTHQVIIPGPEYPHLNIALPPSTTIVF